MNTQATENQPFEQDYSMRHEYLRALGERAMVKRRREFERTATMGVREIVFCLAVYTIALVAATLMLAEPWLRHHPW